jgi:3-isopropylmalate dehydrogenase
MTTKKSYKVLALQGDGIGPEIMREALKILNSFSSLTLSFNIQEELIGGCSIDAYGDSLQDKVKQAALEADAILFGCVGGPKWDSKRKGLEGPEGGLLRLRHALDVYGNIRPCLMPNLALAKKYSPLKPELLDGVDFVVVRENCGGAYFGKKVEDKEYGLFSSGNLSCPDTYVV